MKKETIDETSTEYRARTVRSSEVDALQLEKSPRSLHPVS